MFRHKGKPASVKEAEEQKKLTPEAEAAKPEPVLTAKKHKDASPEALRELLEKNLKWSQIIYEQNRRLNRKLIWGAVGSWLRLLIIIIPLALAVFYLPPVVRDLSNRFGFIWGADPANVAEKVGGSSADQLMDLLHLNPAQKEQVKAMLK